MTHVMGFDFGAARGSLIAYEGIENRKVTAWKHRLPIATGWWRGLGLLPNTFAIESFIDDLAEKAGRDPYEFRLDHLAGSEANQRMAKVLEALRDHVGPDSEVPKDRAQGIACCADAGTMVAQMAEVSIENSEVRVHRIVCAIDCGLVINPDGVRAQCEGAIMMGLSSTLIEDLQVEKGQFLPNNFNAYPLLTMDRAPEIEVLIVTPPGSDKPFGVGEPPIGPVAAAVSNALRRLSGEPVTRLPIRLTQPT